MVLYQLYMYRSNQVTQVCTRRFVWSCIAFDAYGFLVVVVSTTAALACLDVNLKANGAS